MGAYLLTSGVIEVNKGEVIVSEEGAALSESQSGSELPDALRVGC